MTRSAPRRSAARPRPAAPARCALLLALLLAALPAAQPAAANAAAAPAGGAPDKYAGTYRIAHWRDLQARGLAHFFYLHPDGTFLLAADWPGNERSRFVGTWSVTGERLYLNGRGSVHTNQGDWQSEYSRTFRIRVTAGGFTLTPEPAKNRYGLLGWPDPWHFYRRQPVPNLPDKSLPADADAMGRYIAKLLADKAP